MIVADASVLAPALSDDGEDGDRARDALRGERLVAPHLIDVEVLSAWRRQAARGHLTARRFELARADLRDLPLQRAAHARLLARAWELRANLTSYDAMYVALAEALSAPLLTADRRIARAAGINCAVVLVA